MAAVTQADLDALDKLIATGASEVRYADRVVKTAPHDELMKRRAWIVRQLAAADQQTVIQLQFQRGSRPK